MDSNIQDVALLVNAAHDIQLVQHCLGDINHNLRIQQNQASSDELIADCDVIIVCHRYSVEAPAPHIPTSHYPTRLIVLSDKQDEETVVAALEAGAHHYFDINESRSVLRARLNAATRRHLRSNVDILDVWPFKFYVERRKVTHKGVPIHLSPREFALAYFLFSNHGRIVFDTELMVTIWTLPSSMDSRRIDTAVCRIRKKMNLYDNESGWRLHRLRQLGYQLSCDGTQDNANFLPDLSKCLLAPQPVRIGNQTASVGSTSCKDFPNRSTISPSSVSVAMNGGASRT